VIDFDVYDEKYGPNGNWHPEDHQEFVQLLRANRGDYAATILHCCEKVLGGFDRLDIVAHARWYSRYEELAMRKRLALQEWRQVKDIAALAEKQCAERACNRGSSIGILSETRSRFVTRCNSLWHTWRGCHICMQAVTDCCLSRPQSQALREHTKAVIEEWKACKAEEQRAAQEAKAAAQEETKHREQAQQAQRKKALLQAQEQRQREAVSSAPHDVSLSQRSELQKPRLTASVRHALQERNERHLDRRRAAVQAQHQKQTQRERAQAKLLSKVRQRRLCCASHQ
jgi:hypothetical protein